MDVVRLKVFKNELSKGSHPSFSESLYKIRKVIGGNPPTYQLQDEEGDAIKGRYYAAKLSAFKEKNVRDSDGEGREKL